MKQLLRTILAAVGIRNKNFIPKLPSPEDKESVFTFAMSFNGYKHFGSVEAGEANAEARPRETLEDLRNELFFSARGSHHRDDDAYVEIYKELLPLFKKVLGREEI